MDYLLVSVSLCAIEMEIFRRHVTGPEIEASPSPDQKSLIARRWYVVYNDADGRNEPSKRQMLLVLFLFGSIEDNVENNTQIHDHLMRLRTTISSIERYLASVGNNQPNTDEYFIHRCDTSLLAQFSIPDPLTCCPATVRIIPNLFYVKAAVHQYSDPRLVGERSPDMLRIGDPDHVGS